jgi:ABC-type multidrug transport system permease subunit
VCVRAFIYIFFVHMYVCMFVRVLGALFASLFDVNVSRTFSLLMYLVHFRS